ncbi:MAG: hypothetical protein GC178_03795 [Flavobacteriales bacterium]|nr:hypothetical protein [Flavobacteriales bacterium]
MEQFRAKFSFWLAQTVTKLAGRTGWPWLIKLMRRLTGTQLTVEQMLAIRKEIRKKSDSKLLIFGVGNDSLFWMNSNLGGRTVFIEDDDFWLRKIKKRIAGIEAYLVAYDTKIEQWKELLQNQEKLSMQFPSDIADQKWDVVLVDAPTGWGEGTTGRMKSIYAGRQLVGSGDVFVHDCEREVEIAYCDNILKPEHFIKEITAVDVGYLRHYRFQA